MTVIIHCDQNPLMLIDSVLSAMRYLLVLLWLCFTQLEHQMSCTEECRNHSSKEFGLAHHLQKAKQSNRGAELQQNSAQWQDSTRFEAVVPNIAPLLLTHLGAQGIPAWESHDFCHQTHAWRLLILYRLWSAFTLRVFTILSSRFTYM